MTKILSTIATGLLFFLIGFNNNVSVAQEGAASQSAAVKKNLEASHVIANAFATGDISKIDNVVASDFVDHSERGDMGRDSLKAMITTMHQMDPNGKMETIREIADDNYVYSLMHFSGNSNGSMGPKGPYDMTAMEVVRYKDGKAVEHWTYMEPREMMKMMGQGEKKQ
jgi:predicted SnoaL-like aldol condensation-catalyzing enzyme